MMFYDTDYRNTRTASVIAVLLFLMGVAFLFGFLFIRFGSEAREGIEDFNWSIVAIFIPVFTGTFIPIMAAISAQRRKQDARITVQNQHLEMETEKEVQAQAYKQTSRNKRPKFTYCSYCGEKMIGEALFCSQCGTEMRF